MEVVKQVVKAAAARKEKERKAKEKKGVSLLALKTVAKVIKRKPNWKDDHPSKKFVVTPGGVPPKKKPPLKSNQGAGKGVMTFSGPVVEGPHCLLIYKDYAIEEVESFIKPMDIGPCDQLGTEDLGASAVFDLSMICFSSSG